jgi:predicted nucleotidyltransferase
MIENNPNLGILEIVAQALGPLKNEVVFVGGCAAGLLLTQIRAEAIRPTEDVDLVVSVVTTQDYYQFEKRLRERAFTSDQRANAPICRWLFKRVQIDVMPTISNVLGFSNSWYQYAFETAKPFLLPSGQSINLVSAPCFIATKLEAFHSRGKDLNGRPDYLGSHDLEDIVSVIDRRPELLEECTEESNDLRQFLADNFQALLQKEDFNTTLSGHLPGDRASQERLGFLRSKLIALASLTIKS